MLEGEVPLVLVFVQIPNPRREVAPTELLEKRDSYFVATLREIPATLLVALR